jgi:hypothetical protein
MIIASLKNQVGIEPGCYDRIDPLSYSAALARLVATSLKKAIRKIIRLRTHASRQDRTLILMTLHNHADPAACATHFFKLRLTYARK